MVKHASCHTVKCNLLRQTKYSLVKDGQGEKKGGEKSLLFRKNMVYVKAMRPSQRL